MSDRLSDREAVIEALYDIANQLQRIGNALEVIAGMKKKGVYKDDDM